VVDPHREGDIQSRPVAAFTGHAFWNFEGGTQFAQAMNFFKNVAMVGGMLALAAVGPGRYALRS
jgi:putative oxidoreductase